MQLVWAHGRPPRRMCAPPCLAAQGIHVRTVLRRLEDKGYVTHTVSGRTFLFSAAEQRGAVAPRRSSASWTGFATARWRKSWWHGRQPQIKPEHLQALSDKIAKARPTAMASEPVFFALLVASALRSLALGASVLVCENDSGARPAR